MNFGNFSDTGMVREQNEDYYGYFTTPAGSLFIVCDGMGGHNGGEVASRLTVDTISSTFKTALPGRPEELIRVAVSKANRAVYERSLTDPETAGMGTTLVLLLFPRGDEDHPWIAHIGDSRIYRLRNSNIERLTDDHSKVMMLVKLGVITLEEAMHHPDKNVITRALGISREVQPDVRQITIEPGDRFLLCTDGITDLLNDADIAGICSDNDPQGCSEELVREANRRGGHDNSTVQVVDVSAPAKQLKAAFPQETQSFTRPFRGISGRITFISASIILLAVVILFSCRNERLLPVEPQIKPITLNERPAYEVSFILEEGQSIEFEDTFVQRTSDSLFQVMADDLAPDSMQLIYTLMQGNGQLVDTLVVHNEFGYPGLEVQMREFAGCYDSVTVLIESERGVSVNASILPQTVFLNDSIAEVSISLDQLFAQSESEDEYLELEQEFTAWSPQHLEKTYTFLLKYELPSTPMEVISLEPFLCTMVTIQSLPGTRASLGDSVYEFGSNSQQEIRVPLSGELHLRLEHRFCSPLDTVFVISHEEPLIEAGFESWLIDEPMPYSYAVSRLEEANREDPLWKLPTRDEALRLIENGEVVLEGEERIWLESQAGSHSANSMNRFGSVSSTGGSDLPRRVLLVRER